MQRLKTSIMGSYIINVDIYRDSRGFFSEVWNKKKFNLLINENINFVQENFSRSKKNVLRGLHFQIKKPQGKFVTVLKGKIFDVAVDCRLNSKTFGKYFSIILSDQSDFSFFMPQGFAHGFVCLSKTCTVNYKCSNYRHAKTEINLDWQDQDLKIKWPIKKGILSNKDRHGVTFKDLKKML